MNLQLAEPQSFAEWRAQARTALLQGLSPKEVSWNDGAPSLFVDSLKTLSANAAAANPTFSITKKFVELGEQVALHRDPKKWSLLYSILWRLRNEDPHLLDHGFDDDVRTLILMAKDISRDKHKMTAFVRFTETDSLLTAWFEPDHLILESMAPFFVRRFGSKRWLIATPDGLASWDLETLHIEKRSLAKADYKTADALESLWRSYYRNIFNPGRLNESLMKKEMPERYWKNLPEAEDIGALIANAQSRVSRMMQKSGLQAGTDGALVNGAIQFQSIDEMRVAARSCTACDLCDEGTQTVFGIGNPHAELMLVGEQPGDEEDRAGLPFIGPAGRVLREHASTAGVDMDDVYCTNSVKHFHHLQQGKRRLHQRPKTRHIRACRPWITQEIELVKPSLILCLGATAVQSVLGLAMKMSEALDKTHETPFGIPAIATYHPAALLRAPSPELAQSMTDQFRRDLARAKTLAHAFKNAG